MDTEPPPPIVPHSVDADSSLLLPDVITSTNAPDVDKGLVVDDETDADTTIHGFNSSNITVIERQQLDVLDRDNKPPCEGSDSGVEVIETIEYRRALSVLSHDGEILNGARSCDSSIVSYCSNYEEAYNILVRKNSTLLEDYTLRNGDVTSENGSESSSVSGSQTRCTRRSNLAATKKKQPSSSEPKSKSTVSSKERSRSKPPITPASDSASRLRSADRLQSRNCPKTSSANNRTRPTPANLDLNKRDLKRSLSVRATCVNPPTRTSQTTPSDDGRWPSVNSKPAPLMTRSLRGPVDGKQKLTQMESKTIEKYATLPRRRKEKSLENPKDGKKSSNKEPSLNATVLRKSSRENTPSKMFSSLYVTKPKQKTRIYHETNVQTALTMSDIEKALSGTLIAPKDPAVKDICVKSVQVNMTAGDIEKMKEQLKSLAEQCQALRNDHKAQTEKLKETEERLREEKVEKEGLREELTNNSQRVLAILGQAESGECDDANSSSDSLMVLESRFSNVSQVVIRQEEEIARLNSYCRSLHIDLDKSLTAQKILLQQHQDLESESIELQEFMQAEKTTISDALKEAENEIKKLKQLSADKEEELEKEQENSKQLTKLCEQRRIENLGLLARIGSIETKSRELLVHQGSSVSGAAVALSSLIERLNGLAEELVIAYSISDQELEDVIYHNEAYNNSGSSLESTPEKARLFIEQKNSPNGKGSSFVSAVINAIRNAAIGRDVRRENTCTDKSTSNEMLDLETEPCLMMEHVLEDVVVPDGHSHNMISSGHGSMLSSRISNSESLRDVSQAIFNRQYSEPNSLSYSGSLNTSFTSDVHSLSEKFPSFPLVDQVIEVDNVITRLLKVIRIIQLENDDCMNELQDQRDNLAEQIDKHRETNKIVVKQLKDWEILGARLKTEIKELMNQLTKKNNEIDNVKTELNNQREQVEKLNQDVCELSTALAKAELEMKLKEDEVEKEMQRWSETGETPSAQVLGRLFLLQKEIPVLKEKLAQKEKCLNELGHEFSASKQVLSENLKDAVIENKRQYEAIDKALEVFQSIQSVVQQCPPLSKLQRDLEEVSFVTASSMPLATPPDCNANAALLQTVSGIEIAPTINTTA
ncbi:centromere-associated protein E [Cylas formicarius]|uniref:centromere-associated protein E n=1 Tax=Cylas formicarius TaxID=197179 RepID=UPI00295861F9|nr:centromere-associated protein E [Cylas formicarius]XP_060529486.1 centromere-associated protein E [Cylas formicarius]XP_060529487.1 centromere-associated protein E [Cylas formicarius]XP_060529488.1 centromere-associated protein E [Cylas formicarius]